MRPVMKLEFYNKEVKESFINSIPENKRQLAKRLFANSKDIEEEKGKDLCKFNNQDLLEFYSYINLDSPSVLRNMHSMIIRYQEFNNIVNEEIYEIKSDLLRAKANRVAIKRKMLSREDLLNIIYRLKDNPLFNPSDAFIVLAFFEGIEGERGEEVWSTNINDFRKEGDQYYLKLCTGREVKASNELFECAHWSARTTIRVSEGFAKGTSFIRQRPLYGRKAGDVIKTVVKRTGNEEDYSEKMNKTLYNYFKSFRTLSSNIIPPPKKLRMAGLIGQIKEKSAQMGISSETYINDYLEELTEQYQTNNIFNLKKAIRDYL